MTNEARADKYVWADDDIVFDEPAEDKIAIKDVQPLDYWKDYDGLMKDIQHVWLRDYMLRAYSSLSHRDGRNDEVPDTSAVQAALDAHHDDFMVKMLGTDDNPGPLVKLILAGMAAGQSAVVLHRNPAPQKAEQIAIDWNLLAVEARNFAQTYIYNLIRNIDGTTAQAVQAAVTAWIESGAGLDKLQEALTAIFNDEARAQLIAQTESTRAYAEGTLERYRRLEVQAVTWNTVRTSTVCPICEELGSQPPQPIGAGFTTKDGTFTQAPPQHPGCRCWLRPAVI